MNQAELLRKTAAALRTVEGERQEAVSKLEDAKKEATVNRTVLNMLKDGLLDIDEVETKISEFRTNPDLLTKTADYFTKSAGAVGTVKNVEIPGGYSAEEAFLAAMQG